MLVRHVARAWDETHADARLSSKPELLDAMEIAMVFESTGLESGVTYTEESIRGQQDRRRSGFYFREYAIKTAKADTAIVEMCRDAMACMRAYQKESNLHAAARSVFAVVRTLELLRCEDPLSLDQKFRELLPHVGTEERLKQLVELAESAIRATGDEL
eukprot:25397-Pleurochrysis_carterae.AAC.1